MTDETIFATALEKPSLADRAAYVAGACADPEQRKRVEGLLAAHDKASVFLERPAVAPESDFGPTRAFADPGDGPTHTLGDEQPTEAEGEGDLSFLTPPQRPDSLGRIGHYEVLEVLGRGGFGIVFRAFDDVLQRVVAVKVLAPAMAATSPARKRFIREAQSAAKVQHENVVRIHETGEQPLPYLVMEFVAGETLQQRLDRNGPLEVTESLRIARQVAEGLAAAHAQGLIHRDIKPANILIERGPQEHAKITDFGLARAADDASLTRSGVVAGTPMYMAPEQARGETLDHRADLFSLGSVLYAMLTGHPPFRASSTVAVLKRVCEEDPRPIREVIPEVPEWLCRIVEKLHAKDPAGRFQTAREVADLLADCEKQLQVHKELKDASRIPEVKKKIPRRRRSAAMLVVLLLVGFVGLFTLAVMAVGAWVLLSYSPAPQRQHQPAQDAARITDNQGPQPPADGWVQLFNGKDLTGWKHVEHWLGRRLGHDPVDAFVVHGDVLIVKGTPYGFLQSNVELNKPFELRYQWRGTATAQSATHTLYFHEYQSPNPVPKGMMVTLSGEEARVNLPTNTGESRVIKTPRPINEWQDVTIAYDNKSVRVRVNGVQIVEAQCDGFVPSQLVLESVNSNESHLRNIEVRELSTRADDPPLDLIPLARPDAMYGTWKREGTGLVSTPKSAVDKKKFASVLPIHTELPREFIVEAVVERLAGDDTFAMNIPAFGTDFLINIDGFPWRGWFSGLSNIDGKAYSENETASRGQKLTNDHKHLVRITVRATGVAAELDGKTLFDYRGGYEKLTPARATYPGSKFYIQIVDSPFRIHSLSLTPLTAPPPIAVAPFSAAKAKEHQEAWAKHLGVKVEDTNAIGMKLRLIPPGEFTMGSSKEEIDWLLTQAPDLKDAERFIKDWVRAEGPDRRVTVREPFLLGAHEVTVGQFREFVKATSYKTDGERTGGGFDWNTDSKKWEQKPNQVWSNPKYAVGEDHPVKFVTSDDIRAFCDWLSKQDGRKYAIPTEEQWEYACRAGTTTRWSFGDDPDEMRKYGWTAPHASGKYHPVGRQAANPFGLFDMYGNAGELVLTAQGVEYQRGGTATEGPYRARSASRVPVHRDLDPISTRTFRVAVVGDLKPKTPPLAVAPFSAAKAKEHQEAWGRHLGVDVEVENGIGMKLRLIPPGEFTMGCSKAEFDLFKTEGSEAELKRQIPAHAVKLTASYRLGATEVTVGQFRRFIADTKYKTDAERESIGGDVLEGGKHAWKSGIYWDKPGYAHDDDCPVTQVSWNDAVTFCNWLSRQERLPEVYAKEPDGTWRVVPGPGYRLPTEAEWEFACRAGSPARYFFGDDPKRVPDYAWYNGNSGGRPHPVGKLSPNPFGLFDMSGNVREWVADWDDEQDAPKSPATDPRGPGAGARRVMRGGGWSSTASGAQSAFRSHTAPHLRLCYLGFRVAVVGDLKPKAAAGPKKEPNLAVIQPLRDAVSARARAVAAAKAQFEAAKVNALVVLAAQVDLCEAKIKLAEAEGDEPILILNLRELVKLREEERAVIAVRVKAGVEAASELDKADARVAEARARLAKVKPPDVAPPPREKP